MGVSYKISSWESDSGLIGGPERPLSEMGHRSYTRFWQERIARYLLLKGGKQKEADASGSVPLKQKSPKTSKRKHTHELMTVQDIGLATGMLPEDVVTALQGLGAVEPATPAKKRRTKDSSGEAGSGADEALLIRKSKILEWAKSHHMALQDPVRDEGFLGKWAAVDSTEASDVDSDDVDEDAG